MRTHEKERIEFAKLKIALAQKFPYDIDGYCGGKAIPPCGACREFMTQLMPENYRSIEIMLNYEKEKIVTLGELTPEWWI